MSSIEVIAQTNDDSMMNPAHTVAKELKTVLPRHQAQINFIAKCILILIQLLKDDFQSERKSNTQIRIAIPEVCSYTNRGV